MDFVWLLDENFGALAAADTFDSLVWRERCWGAGDFSLRLPPDMAGTALRAAWASWGGSPYTGAAERFERDGKAAVLKGRFMEKGLAMRAALSDKAYSGRAEGVMRRIVFDNCIGPADRRVPLLELGEERGLGGGTAVSPFGAGVAETLDAIALEQGLSWRLRCAHAEKKILFEVFEGPDRTAGQSANPRLVLSEERGNVLEARRKLERGGRNFVFVAGEGGEAVEIDLRAGPEPRRELFVDARNVPRRTGDGYMEPGEYREILRARGLQAAAAYGGAEAAEIDVAPDAAAGIGLGDVATWLCPRTGASMDKRVTEIERVAETGFSGTRITLGRRPPGLADMVRMERGAGK